MIQDEASEQHKVQIQQKLAEFGMLLMPVTPLFLFCDLLPGLMGNAIVEATFASIMGTLSYLIYWLAAVKAVQHSTAPNRDLLRKMYLFASQTILWAMVSIAIVVFPGVVTTSSYINVRLYKIVVSILFGIFLNGLFTLSALSIADGQSQDKRV